MYAAKLAYVSQGRDLIQKGNNCRHQRKSLQGNKNPDDPRVKDLTNKLKELGTKRNSGGRGIPA